MYLNKSIVKVLARNAKAALISLLFQKNLRIFFLIFHTFWSLLQVQLHQTSQSIRKMLSRIIHFRYARLGQEVEQTIACRKKTQAY
jgi:hypothetical protein